MKLYFDLFRKEENMSIFDEGYLRKFIRENFDKGYQEKTFDFFSTRKFSTEGKIYLLSLLIHVGNENRMNKTFLLLAFLWDAMWKYTTIHKRANLALSHTCKKDSVTKREIRFFNEICRAVDVQLLTTERMKELWKEDFQNLPVFVRNKELNIPKPKKKKMETGYVNPNLSPEERLLESIYGQ